MKWEQSKILFEKALCFFPGGVNSPVRAFRSVGGTPRFMVEGKGSRVTDADGNEYIDYCCSWGPLISGHAPDFILHAVEQRIRKGTTFGAPTIEENQLAELILSHHRYVEKIRFVSSGTEAVMSAIRLARGFTGRNKIIKFEGCYHGHADALLVKAGSGLVTFGQSSSEGIPEGTVHDTLVLPLDHPRALEEAFHLYGKDLAAVIIEPVPANNGLLLQKKEFLELIRKLCTKHGTLLIFDEVISGFRIGFEGAAGYYQIAPDLITFGKIIGGGFPAGAYAGKKEIMDMVAPEGKVYQAGTLSGNPVAMCAGHAQLSRCLEKNFYENLRHKTDYLVKGLNSIAPEHFYVHHLESIFWISFSSHRRISSSNQISMEDIKLFNQLYHRLLEKGIYFGPSGYEVGFISEAHSQEDLDYTLQVFRQLVPETLALC